ncbi:hypothetical protein ACJX0J_012210, partial [Zea mays]
NMMIEKHICVWSIIPMCRAQYNFHHIIAVKNRVVRYMTLQGASKVIHTFKSSRGTRQESDADRLTTMMTAPLATFSCSHVDNNFMYSSMFYFYVSRFTMHNSIAHHATELRLIEKPDQHLATLIISNINNHVI